MTRTTIPRVLGTALVCIALLCASTALGGKRYGFNDEECGFGTAFTPAESTKIANTLAKLGGLIDIEIKSGFKVKADSIAGDLQDMLKDGRLGKGDAADQNVNGGCRRDGKTTTNGDRINISDHFIEDRRTDNKRLASVMVHEWTHATQADGRSQADREAEAYQMEDEVYLMKGGRVGDGHDKAIQKKIDKWKEQLEAHQQTLDGSNTPKNCVAQLHGGQGNEYILFPGGFGDPEEVINWWDDGTTASVEPLPLHTFFVNAMGLRPGADDLLMVFGSDTTIHGGPLGWLTTVDADSMSFTNRQEFVFADLRHPYNVAYDEASGIYYVLDTYDTGPGIVAMLDSNGDLIPDDVMPEPFASRAFPGVAGARHIRLADHPSFGRGLILWEQDVRDADDFGRADLVTFIVDADGDGVADATHIVPEYDFVSFAPTISATPRSEDVEVEVVGMPGHLVEVWATDASGDTRLELLGSALAVPEAFLVPLGRPLAFGEYVLPVDATDDTEPALATLVDTPAVPGLAPWRVVALLMLLAGTGVWVIGHPRNRISRCASR